MVAIALYRGNLHRVPNAPPRRWPSPERSLSVGKFKSLLRRRTVALSRLRRNEGIQTEKKVLEEEAIVEEKEGEKDGLEKKEEERVCELKDEMEGNGKEKENSCEKLDPAVQEEVSKTDPAQTEREERKKELGKKLEDLNQKKHNLVQMLKQILNAEEEIKKRTSQPPSRGPNQGGPMENGHLASTTTIRLNVDVNFCADSVGDSNADPGSTQSAPARQTREFGQMFSPSASSLSSLSRSPFVHNQRGQLGHATSLPPLLPLPGNNNNNNNYMAPSPSPSPAASGGTSVFRDNSRFI